MRVLSYSRTLAPSKPLPTTPSLRRHVDVPAGFVAGAVYFPWVARNGSSIRQLSRAVTCRKLGVEKVERAELTTELRQVAMGVLPEDVTFLDARACVERTRGGLTVLEKSTLPTWLSDQWG